MPMKESNKRLCILFSFFLIFFFSETSLYAQNDSIVKLEIKELSKSLNKARKSRDKIKILNQLALKKAKINPASAINDARKALSLSREEESNYAIANSNHTMGKIYLEMNEPFLAREYFIKGLEHADLSNNIQLLTELYSALARLALKENNYTEATRYYNLLIRKNHNKNWRNYVLGQMELGNAYLLHDSVNKAIDSYQRSLQLSKYLEKSEKASIYYMMGKAYTSLNKNNNALKYYTRALSNTLVKEDTAHYLTLLNGAAKMALVNGKYDQAMDLAERANQLSMSFNHPYFQGLAKGITGKILWHVDSTFQAIDFLVEGINLLGETSINHKNNDKFSREMSDFMIFLGRTYDTLGYYPRSIDYLQRAFDIGKSLSDIKIIRESSKHLAHAYQMQNLEQDAKLYDSLSVLVSDTLTEKELTGLLTIMEMQAGFNKQKEIQRLIQEKKDAEIDAHLRTQMLVRNFFIFSFAIVLVFAFLAFRGLRRIRKDNIKLSAQQKEILEINEQMNQQKEEVMAQAEQIEMTNHELERKNDQLRMRNLQIKKSQQQLILQEKLATVGQLTTGIAHEIKNPLNFVNNFSNLTNELAKELREILEQPDGQEKEEKQEQVRELLEMIESNVKKINEHGKRADRIIKGMLQQSRDAREFELTDFNTLVSEYVNLAYHGERAKDQSFSLNLIKDLDSNIGNVNLVSHDFGRVILNLIGNACYALRQKLHLNGKEFTPEIKIFSYTKKDNIYLKIRDNGIGIPKEVKTKIFNPFFTTKPSGEGTGLGLSTSYEIITKTHKGTIEVKSTEGVYTEFEIMVPRNL